jgi:filamentous hemagglutinin family protein
VSPWRPRRHAQEAPQGGTVVAGDATITSLPGSTVINQSSARAVLDWQRFDIGVGGSVRFVQPDGSSVALNRVLGADPSSLLGSLTANGQVFLVNPNGILFGTGAQVNVGGLVASTRPLAIDDFLAGSYRFGGSGSAAGIVNQGAIEAPGGYIALLGASVDNQGVLAARLGRITLAAGDAYALDFGGDGLLQVAVTAGAADALVHNGGVVQADGGQVLLTARSASALLQSAVNNDGLVQARTIENRAGSIRLLGDMQAGTVNAGGRLDASAPSTGDGGFIETSAAQVRFAPGGVFTTAAASGNAGQWLIDPSDFTIAASGGDMTGAQLTASLGLGNVTILSGAGAAGVDGDIHVNDPVSWSANLLTLDAARNIDINSTLRASGSGALALRYGQAEIAAGNPAIVDVRAPVDLPAGSSLSMRLGSDGAVHGYTVINDMAALQAVNSGLSGRYALGSDLDATGVAGFVPLGPVTQYDGANAFSGTFDGLGHAIRNLTINRPGNNFTGLFGAIGGSGMVRNLAVVDVNVTGAIDVGGIVGLLFGSVANSSVTGTTHGNDVVGGLAGYSAVGSIQRSWTHVAVTTGPNWDYSGGGIVGYNYVGTITDSYAVGPVVSSYAGGVAGVNNGGTISRSFTTSVVSASLYGQGPSGLVGRAYNGGSVIDSYWDLGISTQPNSDGGTPLSTAQLQAALPTGFSPTVWGNGGNQTTPYLLGNPGPALIATDPGNAYFTIVQGVEALQRVAANLAGNYALGNDVDARATRGWNGGLGFAPLGDGGTPFTGRFDGLGHVVSGLVIDRPASDFVGLFGNGAAAEIRNLGLTDVEVTGGNQVGALLGAAVVGAANRVHATGQVHGQASVGGLVGYLNSMPLSDSYATTDVTGVDRVGGLVGETNGGTLAERNFASGSVTASGDDVGGLVGYNGFAFGLSDSYATGAVAGVNRVGGLIGYNLNGSATRSYASGSVTGTSGVGGLLGDSGSGSFADSFWNSESSGQVTSAGGVAMTTAQMRQRASFGGWDFAGTWTGFDGHTSPLLRAFMTGLTVTAPDVTRTYDGLAYGGNAGATYSAAPDPAHLSGTLVLYSAGRNAGTTAITASGLWSDQLGYDITYVAGVQTVERFAVSLSGSRVYDGTGDVEAAILTLGALANGESLTLTGGGTADRNAGSHRPVALGTLALGDGSGLAGNYTLVGGTHTVDIGAASLTVGTSDVSKVYDGGFSAAGSVVVVAGTLFAGDTLSGGSFAFTDRNAGSGDRSVTTSSATVADGSGGANYDVAYVRNTTSTITRATLTATATAADKVYDGTTLASASLQLAGLVGAESLTASSVAAFDSRDVASARRVTISSVTLTDGAGGGLAGNYTLAAGQTAAARITPRALTVVDQRALPKVYDGTTAATLTGGSLAGVLAGDVVSLAEAGAFVTADPGSAVAVLAGNSLGGLAAPNYSLVQPHGLSADIMAVVIAPAPSAPAVPAGPEAPALPQGPSAPVVPATTDAPVLAGVDVRTTPGYQAAVVQAPVVRSIQIREAPVPGSPARNLRTPAMPGLAGLDLSVETGRDDPAEPK